VSVADEPPLMLSALLLDVPPAAFAPPVLSLEAPVPLVEEEQARKPSQRSASAEAGFRMVFQITC
jgi:hypothetical protein